MIFRRKRAADLDPAQETEVAELDEAAGDDDRDGTDDDSTDTDGADSNEAGADNEAAALAELDEAEWRTTGPWDLDEVDDLDDDEAHGPRIDLGSMVLTGVAGSELRLQVAEDSQQIVSAMLIIESVVPTDTGAEQTVTSALELGAYAAPRSGGYWPELREEIAVAAVEAGGQATFSPGPFGVELFRLFPVTTPEGEEGYQPSKMWVAEGPRWLLRGIVYGQAAIEESDEAPAVLDVAQAFRQVVVRRGADPMAPGDLLPLVMPAGAVAAEPS